jgi:hypothetical protein
MEVAQSSDTSANFYQTTWLYIPEYSTLHNWSYRKIIQYKHSI